MTVHPASTTTCKPRPRTLCLGSVSSLNAKPLVYGLDAADDLRLSFDVPSKLLDGLRDRRFDVALLPVIDYQRLDDLVVIPAGGIGSDGPKSPSGQRGIDALEEFQKEDADSIAFGQQAIATGVGNYLDETLGAELRQVVAE